MQNILNSFSPVTFYIEIKTIYRGEPKDKNIEIEQMIYRHTE